MLIISREFRMCRRWYDGTLLVPPMVRWYTTCAADGTLLVPPMVQCEHKLPLINYIGSFTYDFFICNNLSIIIISSIIFIIIIYNIIFIIFIHNIISIIIIYNVITKPGTSVTCLNRSFIRKLKINTQIWIIFFKRFGILSHH